jgi:hypothetical protein
MWVLAQGADAAADARGRVVFDGAHGIGAPKLALLAPHMSKYLNIEIRNGVEGPGELNDGVGAEHVQKTRTCAHILRAHACYTVAALLLVINVSCL